MGDLEGGLLAENGGFGRRARCRPDRMADNLLNPH